MAKPILIKPQSKFCQKKTIHTCLSNHMFECKCKNDEMNTICQIKLLGDNTLSLHSDLIFPFCFGYRIDVCPLIELDRYQIVLHICAKTPCICMVVVIVLLLCC